MPRKYLHTLIVLICLAWNIGSAHAQDLTDLGGDLSTDLPGRAALQAPAPNIQTDATRLKQVNGFDPFHSRLTKERGLGPRFVNIGCGSCHIQNGKGQVNITNQVRRKNQMVVKVSQIDQVDEQGGPVSVKRAGLQLQDRSLKKSYYRMRLRYRKRKGRFADGTSYRLRKPRLSFRVAGVQSKQIASSLRMTPGLIGLGLLESIPEEDVLALSDPDDTNADGISGIPNYVYDRRTQTLRLGRFGFKAGQPTLEQQSAAAAFFDMGVTSSLFAESGTSQELSDLTLEQLAVYQALAGVPRARNQDLPEVIAGKAHFQSLGCADCHRMTFTTRNTEFSELDGQLVHPFTDLLLHDMGPGLADKHREFSATGSEWRTTPLWGIGFFASVSGVAQRYLHDGRARTIEEAILWHGGEAKSAQQRYLEASKSERDELLSFLNSL